MNIYITQLCFVMSMPIPIYLSVILCRAYADEAKEFVKACLIGHQVCRRTISDMLPFLSHLCAIFWGIFCGRIFLFILT